jgi:hypothetical protein
MERARLCGGNELQVQPVRQAKTKVGPIAPWPDSGQPFLNTPGRDPALLFRFACFAKNDRLRHGPHWELLGPGGPLLRGRTSCGKIG